MYKELYQALERGADRIWVFNVADIKPMEVPLAFAMDLAWHSSRFNFGSIPAYLETFAAREFGADHAEEIGAILLEQSRLIGRRKYESTTPLTYSFHNYNELNRVLVEWEELGARVAIMRDSLSSDYHAAFFHLVQYPIQAGLLYHRIVLRQSINQQYAIERRNTANDIAYSILADAEEDIDLLEEYNTLLEQLHRQCGDTEKLAMMAVFMKDESESFMRKMVEIVSVLDTMPESLIIVL